MVRDIWRRSGGRAGWMRSGCGRSRTAGTSRAVSSRRCWRRVSGSYGLPRTGWVPLARGSASRASRMRSTRWRSPGRSSRKALRASRSRLWTGGRWRSGCCWIRRLNHNIEQLKSELLELVKAHRLQLLADMGCGTLVAAILIGHTAGVQRFGSEASLMASFADAPAGPGPPGRTCESAHSERFAQLLVTVSGWSKALRRPLRRRPVQQGGSQGLPKARGWSSRLDLRSR